MATTMTMGTSFSLSLSLSVSVCEDCAMRGFAGATSSFANPLRIALSLSVFTKKPSPLPYVLRFLPLPLSFTTPHPPPRSIRPSTCLHHS